MFSLKPYITFLILLLLSITTALQAQNNLSVKGKFTVNFIKGCSSLEVTPEAVPSKTLAPLFYRYKYVGDEQTGNVSPPVTFQLSKPGTYWIYQFENSTPGVRESELDSIRVVVYEPESPSFQAYICSARRVFVEVEKGIYDYYHVKTGPSGPEVRLDADNNFQAYMEFPTAGSKTLTVEGRFSNYGNDTGCGINQKDIVVTDIIPPPILKEIQADVQAKTAAFQFEMQPNTFQVLEAQIGGSGNFVPLDTLEGNETTIRLEKIGQEYICFRIANHNRCDQTKTFSQVLCTTSLIGTSSLNGNEIVYRTAPTDNLRNVALLKNGQEIHNFNEATNGSFADTDVSCKTTYQYAVRLTYENGASITENLAVQTQIQGELKAPENIFSSWENNAPVYTIALSSPPAGARYFAYIHKGNSVTEVNNSEVNSLKINWSKGYTCPGFGYSDDCGNKSAISREVCPLYLTNESDQPDGLHLVWNEYTGYREGVSKYVVEKIGSNGQVLQEVYEGTGTSINLGEQALEESGSVYRVTAYPVNSLLEVSSSNPLHFQINTEPHFPNIFSPNGDGVNDNFKPEGKFVVNYELEIFNSWGELVFRTKDKEKGWDGTIKGRTAPQGTYAYQATITTEDQKQHKKKGTVFLLKK